MLARALATGLCAVVLSGCPAGVKRPAVTPDVDAILAHIQGQHDGAISHKSDSDMEYWVKGERIKAAVSVLSKRGARIRMQALSPAGGSALADLACDGTGFNFIDYEHNCYINGMCDATTIAQLLRIQLEPDDFLLMSVGTTPVVEQPTGSIEWNSKGGHWEIKLIADDNSATQIMHVSGNPREWDVLMSEKRNARGQIEWRVTNKGFHPIKGRDGKTYRVAQRSRLEQPMQKGDLTVRWYDERSALSRELNGAVDETLFTITVPDGLAACPAAAAPAH